MIYRAMHNALEALSRLTQSEDEDIALAAATHILNAYDDIMLRHDFTYTRDQDDEDEDCDYCEAECDCDHGIVGESSGCGMSYSPSESDQRIVNYVVSDLLTFLGTNRQE